MDQDLKDSIVRIDERLKHVVADLDEIKDALTNHYVTRQEFEPVKLLVYGLVSLILTAVIISILVLVIR